MVNQGLDMEKDSRTSRLECRARVISTDQLLEKIKPGQKIFVSSGAATPGKMLSAITQSEARNIRDLEIIQIITLGDYLSHSNARQYRLKTFNIGESISKEVAEGKIDFIPANLMELPYIFLSGAVGDFNSCDFRLGDDARRIRRCFNGPQPLLRRSDHRELLLRQQGAL